MPPGYDTRLHTLRHLRRCQPVPSEQYQFIPHHRNIG